MEHYYQEPVEFQKLLQDRGFIDDIYKSIQQNDKGDTVVTALEILKKTNKMPLIPKSPESGDASRFFRQLGDQSLEEEDCRSAFILYNQAIRCAPKDSSHPMLEAYFSRSRLLFEAGTCPAACIANIDKCLAWKNTSMESKLKKMKAISQRKLKTIRTPPQNRFIDKFFDIVERHPKVPSVSAAVDFVVENGQAKIVAGKNIPAGSLVALEKAYVGHLDAANQIRACHYCHAFSLNLIPCDSCRYVLFCSEECKKLCWEEYHNVECHIIHIHDLISAHNVIYPLTVKAALKLKNKCSWDEFKSISLNLGLEEMTSSLINEVYDVNNKVSILRCNNNKRFVFGQTYNAAFMYAFIIHYLESVPSFFPRDHKAKDEAIRALGRVLVHLYEASGHIPKIRNIAKDSMSEEIATIHETNYGLYSFTSKLKHSCDPNLYVVGLNNKVALLALKPIKSGEQLTISYFGHWHDTMSLNRPLAMFIWSEIACRCRVCVEDWNPLNLRTAIMSEQQQQIYKKWNQLKCALYLSMVDLSVMYRESWFCLNVFHNLANTKEHKQIFDEIRRLILLVQYEMTNNCTVLVEPKNNVLELRSAE